MQLPNSSFSIAKGGRAARLKLRGLPLIETFQFGNLIATPGQVDVDVVWRATGPQVERGSGNAVAPTDPAAFIGQFAEARCVGTARAVETGFSFRTRRLDASGFFAELGPERNGIFL